MQKLEFKQIIEMYLSNLDGIENISIEILSIEEHKRRLKNLQEYLRSEYMSPIETRDIIDYYIDFCYRSWRRKRVTEERISFFSSITSDRIVISIDFTKYIESVMKFDMERTIIKLSNSILTEDLQSVLGDQIARENRKNRSFLMRNIAIIYLLLNIFWGGIVIPYLQNKFLPSKNKVD